MKSSLLRDLILVLTLCGCASDEEQPKRFDHVEAGVMPARLEVEPASLDFPATAVGETSANLMVRIQNRGQGTAGRPVLSVVGGSFIVVSDTCGPAINGSVSCTVLVAFRPIAVGPVGGILDISAAPGGRRYVELKGTGLAAAPRAARGS